jgi:hypothetical protein
MIAVGIDCGVRMNRAEIPYALGCIPFDLTPGKKRSDGVPKSKAPVYLHVSDDSFPIQRGLSFRVLLSATKPA